MNCVDFRRLALTELKPRDSEFWKHKNACAGCGPYYGRVQRINVRLDRALSVTPPGGLSSRILLRQSFVRRRRPQLYALAASLLAVAIGVGLVWKVPMTPLQHDVLAHAMEPHVPAVAEPVSQEALVRVLAQLGGDLQEPLPFAVFYAKRCRIAGHYAAHLLVDTPDGPVTLFLMPESTTHDRMESRQGHIRTLVLPAKRGSIGLVAPQHVDLSPIETQVRSAINWSA